MKSISTTSTTGVGNAAISSYCKKVFIRALFIACFERFPELSQQWESLGSHFRSKSSQMIGQFCVVPSELIDKFLIRGNEFSPKIHSQAHVGAIIDCYVVLFRDL